MGQERALAAAGAVKLRSNPPRPQTPKNTNPNLPRRLPKLRMKDRDTSKISRLSSARSEVFCSALQWRRLKSLRRCYTLYKRFSGVRALRTCLSLGCGASRLKKGSRLFTRRWAWCTRSSGYAAYDVWPATLGLWDAGRVSVFGFMASGL